MVTRQADAFTIARQEEHYALLLVSARHVTLQYMLVAHVWFALHHGYAHGRHAYAYRHVTLLLLPTHYRSVNTVNAYDITLTPAIITSLPARLIRVYGVNAIDEYHTPLVGRLSYH